MIDRQEIIAFSGEFGLTANVIEKDYVLGWLLAGISSHHELGSSWTFKGGTCLKKCYFETYRFSEDLDFTVMQAAHQNQDFLVGAFKNIADWIYDASGIEIPHELIRFDVYTNPRGKISVQGRIGYRGPLKPGGDLPRVKLDLTDDEVLVLNPVTREVHHPYTDKPDSGISVQCYSFEEVFAEKIRALVERLRPRDLYDVIHLYRHDDIKPNREIVLSTLQDKCSFKGIDLPSMESLNKRPEYDELRLEWASMLAHQLQILPPFERFWSDLPDVFEWLYRAVGKSAQPTITTIGDSIGGGWQIPAGLVGSQLKSPMERIRFAAANRLCVQLNYTDADGIRKKPIIEPYSLRRTKDGKLLLYAVKHLTGDDRAYRLDRIHGVQVTDTPFVPRYTIELTATGSISAPSTRRVFDYPSISPSRSTHPRRDALRKISTSSGPKYVFKCIVCGKQFTRKSYDFTLNQHKNKQGYPCFGRTGSYITMK